jgi:hypothetical protein
VDAALRAERAPTPQEESRLRAVLREAVDRLDAELCSEDMDAEAVCQDVLPELRDFLKREADWHVSKAGASPADAVQALIAKVRQRIAEDTNSDSEYCWYCLQDVNGKNGPVQPHADNCWAIKVQELADALVGRPQVIEKKD